MSGLIFEGNSSHMCKTWEGLRSILYLVVVNRVAALQGFVYAA
jgi:hypothetical protein